MTLLGERPISTRADEWDSKVFPLLQEKVFHVTRPSAYAGICADNSPRSHSMVAMPVRPLAK